MFPRRPISDSGGQRPVKPPITSAPTMAGPNPCFSQSSRVAGRGGERVIRGDGDVVYATGIDPKGGTIWRLYRPGATYTAPDGEVLGYEQQYLGTARVERFADVSTLRITMAREEIVIGDRLVPAPPEQIVNYAPHPPAHPVDGQIIRLNRDAAEAGRGWVVTIDKGQADGVDVGTVLAIYQVVAPIPDPRPNLSPWLIWRWWQPTIFYQEEQFVHVPDERIGLAFVFRVFDRVSYALVLNTTDPVEDGDWVRKP